MTNSQNPLLTVTGELSTSTPVPGVTSYGRWEPYHWINNGTCQHGARLVPQVAPWHSLFVSVDATGAELPDTPVSVAEEAAAMVAACLLNGSYLHVLTYGEIYPDFERDPSLSRISNDEMMRINLEFSSGLAQWLRDRDRDPSVTQRRTRATRRLLEASWLPVDHVMTEHENDIHKASQHLSRMRAELGKAPADDTRDKELVARDDANRLVADAYRSGPIESFHAGRFNHGTEIPGFRRFTSGEIAHVATVTWRKLSLMLMLRETGSASMIGLLKPRDWSMTQETSPVVYPGMPESPNFDARLQWLGCAYPESFQER